MLPLDYLHALCLVGVALYMWKREPLRLLLTPLMLASFFVLYGVGNIIYFVGADTLPEVRRAVTLSMILMWLGLLAGIELARGSFPSLMREASLALRDWKGSPLADRAQADQFLGAIAVLAAFFMLGVFYGFGKPGQIATYLAIESTHAKQRYRVEMSGQGGYLYQILVASVAPFLSFLLWSKAAVRRQLSLVGGAVLLSLAVFAGKIGTFQKVPWLIYLLQLLLLHQTAKRLELGTGRIVLLLLLLVGGAMAAALIAIPELQTIRIFEWLAYRFFEVNNEVIYQTFYVYPHYLPHTWGMNIGLLHSVFGRGALVSAHTEVANFFGAEGATFDAFFVADAWVDFSYVGVVAMAVVVGYTVKSIDTYILSRGKTPLAVALLVSSMYGLFELQVTSAFTAFLTGGLLFIPLLVALSEGLMNDLARGRTQWLR